MHKLYIKFLISLLNDVYISTLIFNWSWNKENFLKPTAYHIFCFVDRALKICWVHTKIVKNIYQLKKTCRQMNILIKW